MSRSAGRGYVHGRVKRAFDLTASLVSLVVLAPIFLILALLVVTCSGHPIFFTQERIGKDGRPFRLLKFRTMRVGSDRGLPLTALADRRVTRVGRLLRVTKLDELPQLVNVLRGEMSLIGPRPEVPRYVANYSVEERRVLQARPGMTDPASVFFVEEESLLAAVEEVRRERYYVEVILPRKLRINLEYMERAGFWYDLGLILLTLRAILRRQPS